MSHKHLPQFSKLIQVSHSGRGYVTVNIPSMSIYVSIDIDHKFKARYDEIYAMNHISEIEKKALFVEADMAWRKAMNEAEAEAMKQAKEEFNKKK